LARDAQIRELECEIESWETKFGLGRDELLLTKAKARAEERAAAAREAKKVAKLPKLQARMSYPRK